MERRQEFEVFYQKVEADLALIDEIIKREELCNTRESQLLTKATGLQKEKDEIDKQKATIEQEKQYLAKSLLKLSENQQIEKRLDEKREEILKIKDQAEIAQKNAEEKITQLAFVKKEKEEYEEKERALQKREEIMDQRAEYLNQQEIANKSEALRLQKIADRFS